MSEECKHQYVIEGDFSMYYREVDITHGFIVWTDDVTDCFTLPVAFGVEAIQEIMRLVQATRKHKLGNKVIDSPESYFVTIKTKKELGL